MERRVQSWSVVAAVACAAGQAAAQTTFETVGGQLKFEVYNPVLGAWGSEYNGAVAGERVEFRAVASYVGTRTDLFAMGEVLYQPTISNADNTGVGAEADQVGAWRNGGNGGNSVAGSMLTEAEGNDGGPLASYGRVRFGGTACTATGSNTLTAFRHTNGSDGAPPGSWIRMAGSYVSQWPQPQTGLPSAALINLILRGVSSQQQSQSLAPVFHAPGVQNMVIFRQSITLSSDPSARQLEFSTFLAAFRRAGGTIAPDDTRYVSWQTGPADSGSHRTGVTIVPATIWVNIPAPGAGFAFIVFGLSAARRRRSGLGSVVPFRSTP